MKSFILAVTAAVATARLEFRDAVLKEINYQTVYTEETYNKNQMSLTVNWTTAELVQADGNEAYILAMAF